MQLICRWRIVVHGGVDGYSRLPVFLHASCNNRATTVLGLFTKAVEEYGLPSRVRCDKGGENYEVGWFMLNHPNGGPGREVSLPVCIHFASISTMLSFIHIATV